MDNSRPITRSVSSQLGHRDTSVDSPKVESGGESHERQPPAAEGVAVMAAIQSLGEALEGYSARVSSMEEQFRLLSPSVQGLVVQSGEEQRTMSGHSPASPSTPSRRVPHLVKPGEFDGSSSWASFIAQFKLIAATQEWHMADRLAILVASLKGPALELFARLPESDQTDFGRLTDALEGRFGIANQEPWFRSQLRRRRRDAGETLPHLAQDIERLVSMAYPSASVELTDSLACDSFLDALGDAELHIAVRQSRPTNLPQALASAVEIEAVRRAAGITTPPLHSAALVRQGKGPQESQGRTDSGASSESEMTRGLREILRLLNDMQSSLSGPAGCAGRGGSAAGRTQARDKLGGRTLTTGACWECGIVGHFRRDCPSISNNRTGPHTHRGNE